MLRNLRSDLLRFLPTSPSPHPTPLPQAPLTPGSHQCPGSDVCFVFLFVLFWFGLFCFGFLIPALNVFLSVPAGDTLKPRGLLTEQAKLRHFQGHPEKLGALGLSQCWAEFWNEALSAPSFFMLPSVSLEGGIFLGLSLAILQKRLFYCLKFITDHYPICDIQASLPQVHLSCLNPRFWEEVPQE